MGFFNSAPTFRLLKDDDIAHNVAKLVKGAEQELLLVSPYLDLRHWQHLVNDIRTAAGRLSTPPMLMIRKDDKGGQTLLTDEGIKRIREDGLKLDVLAVPYLHAKIYMSEKAAIVGSMNLLSFSASNSREIAFAVDDAATLRELREYIEDLRKTATAIAVDAPTAAATTTSRPTASIRQKPAEPPARPATPRLTAQEEKARGAIARAFAFQAHCIRCDGEVEFNMDRPLCKDCYRSWSRYSDVNYKERFCHRCGKAHATSVARPVCLTCFKVVNAR